MRNVPIDPTALMRSMPGSLLAIGLWVVGAELLIIALQYFGADLLGALSRGFRWFRTALGVVWPVLTFLTLGTMMATGQLLLAAFGWWTNWTEVSRATLRYVTEVSSMVGLLQTFINLAGAQAVLNPNLPQKELLVALTRNSAEAYWATIVALALALVAYTVQTVSNWRSAQ